MDSKTTREVLVTLIADALKEGAKIQATGPVRDNTMAAGTIAGLLWGVAKLAAAAYAVDEQAARHTILREVEGVHLSASDAELRDDTWTTEQASGILAKVILL